MSLTEFLQQFFDNQPPPKLPVFYLLANAHKQGFGLSSIGRFPSRPVVGMHRWATTPCSIFLATCGTILLKADRALHPLETVYIYMINRHGSKLDKEICKCGGNYGPPFDQCRDRLSAATHKETVYDQSSWFKNGQRNLQMWGQLRSTIRAVP